jgi:hypothetical protein
MYQALKTLFGVLLCAAISGCATHYTTPAGGVSLAEITDEDLRSPAEKLRADVLLVYSINTIFSVEGRQLGPLSLISLGMLPNKKAHVTATVAGVLVDVRTGFIYGSTEATVTQTQRSSIWSTEQAIDTARMNAERNAFGDFVGEFEKLWDSVLASRALADS